MVERGGRARSRRVADVTAKTLRDVIVRNADRASWLMTDESTVYPGIGAEFKGHGTVNHSRRRIRAARRLLHDEQRRSRSSRC